VVGHPLPLAARPGDRAHPDGRKFFAGLTARLVAYAEWEFRLSKPLPDGSNLRDSFASYRRGTGKTHPDDYWPHREPKGGHYILEWFWDLNFGRNATTAGYLGISAAEIVAWCSLRRIRLRGWELDALRRLDAKFLQVMGEKD
jgi:hypothetical protein